jgi:diphthine synthase
MFYIIGLGLSNEKDITVNGLEVGSRLKTFISRKLIYRSIQAVKKCTRVYLEAYTSILMVHQDRLVRTIISSNGSYLDPDLVI